MNNVTTISQEGENVLLELMNNGVKFRRWRVYETPIAPNRRQTSQEDLVSDLR